MSMSGRTDYFALKTYQLGDTVNFMPDFNDDMVTIDAQMHANQQTGLQNSQALETQEKALGNMQNEIEEVQSSLSPLAKWEVITATPNAGNTFTQAPTVVLTSNALIMNGTSAKPSGKNVNTFEVKIDSTNAWNVPFFSIPGNPLNLPVGVLNYKIVSFVPISMVIDTSTAFAYMFGLIAWYAGEVTNFGFHPSKDSTATFYNIYYPGITIPIVPFN